MPKISPAVQATPVAQAAINEVVPQLPSIEGLPMWFDVLSDLAVMASCERMPRMGNLLWSIEKLSEKFADDARKIVSAQIATGVDHE